jgi:hypothetical protein
MIRICAAKVLRAVLDRLGGVVLLGMVVCAKSFTDWMLV